MVHSLFLRKHAELLNQCRTEPLIVLLQINTSDEATKGGLPFDRTAIVELARFAKDCKKLRFAGFMTIGSPDAPATDFDRLKECKQWILEDFPETNEIELSMGMSSDYLLAVKQSYSAIDY